MGNKALVPLELYTSGSNPTAPTPPEGAIYYNSTSDEIRAYNGASWVAVGGSGGTPATTVTTLDGLQSAVVGTATNYAREDHKHAVTNLVALTGAQTVAGIKEFSNNVFGRDGFYAATVGDLYQAYMTASSTSTANHFAVYNDGSGITWSVDGRGRIMYYDSTDMTTKGAMIAGGTGGGRLVTVGANGTVLTADSSNARGVTWVENAIPIIFTVNGQLGVAAGVSRVGVEGNYTIAGVRTRVDTAPTGASIKVDVNKNGTTLWSTQGNRPDIAVSTNASSYVTNMDTTTLASGDYLTMDVDQIGSTIAGSHLTVTVWMVRTS